VIDYSSALSIRGGSIKTRYRLCRYRHFWPKISAILYCSTLWPTQSSQWRP